MNPDATPSSRPRQTTLDREMVATAVFVIAASLLALVFAITVAPYTA